MELIFKTIMRVLLIMAVAVTIFLTLPCCVATIRDMAGYIPGIGSVDTTVIDSEHKVTVPGMSGQFTPETVWPEDQIPGVGTNAAIFPTLVGTKHGSTEETPGTQPEAPCISEADWASALAKPQPIPADLNRKLIFMDYNAITSIPHLSSARLDGSEIQPLVENGQNASVSPDGSRVVYVGPDGVSFLHLNAGISELIPGTSPNADIPQAAWSPDGLQVGFTDTFDGRSPKNIFLAKPDGSAPRLLASDDPLKLMRGWMPDGRILYVTLDNNGPVLKLIDPVNGEATSLFNLPELAIPGAFSKDGKHIALDWLDQKTSKQTLYILTLDGSQRKPLLELTSDGYIRNMLWTPDGNWLLVDLSRNVAKEPYSKALVLVDTCQIIPVLNLEGTVLDWIP